MVPLLLESLAPVADGLRGTLPEPVRRSMWPGRGWRRRSAITGPRSARSTSPSTTWSASDSECPVRGPARRAGEIPPTDFTLGIDEPAVVAERARRASDFPASRSSSAGLADVETLEAVRAVYPGPIRVDANTGWTPDGALALLPELERPRRELIEQPFPAGRLDTLRDLQARSRLPVVADESAVTIEDLDGLVGVVNGVNVKLAKCARDRAGAADAGAGEGLGFRTFLGCMEETSLASRPRAWSRRSRTGWTSTAACSWPATRSRA